MHDDDFHRRRGAAARRPPAGRTAARRGSTGRSSTRRSDGPRRPDGPWGGPRRNGGSAKNRRGRPIPATAVSRRRGGLPRALYFGAAALLMVAVGGAAIGAVLLRSGTEPAAPGFAMGRPGASGVAPAAYSDAASSPVFAGIDQRSADAAPLTQGEVFSRVLLDEDVRARLTLADARVDADCAIAIWGARLGDELRAGGCTQVARGAYLDKKAGYSAMVAIINLATAADANRIVNLLGDNAGSGFVKPLAEVDGFDRGFNVARGRAMGHYAVIGWVRRLDGKGDAQNEALLSLLVTVDGPKEILNRAAGARGSATGSN